MYGYIYKTENKITHEIYIGQKKSKKFIKSYYGSGKHIKKNLEIYGKKNFIVELLETADDECELNELEVKYIQKYKNEYMDRCINQAHGGKGGNVFEYASNDEIDKFKNKMTKINKKRCNDENFKKQTSERMHKKYSNLKEREKQSIKIKKSWSNPELRNAQSKKLKEYYKKNKKDNSYNNKQCSFELNDTFIIFNSIKELKTYIKSNFDVEFSNPALKRMLETGSAYIPFHRKKKKLLKLEGMILRYVDKKV